jgi:hypothetical protein
MISLLKMKKQKPREVKQLAKNDVTITGWDTI